jgi:hypothetical protein
LNPRGGKIFLREAPVNSRTKYFRSSRSFPHQEQRSSASSGAARPFLIGSSEALPQQGQPDLSTPRAARPASSAVAGLSLPGAAMLCLIGGSQAPPHREQQGSASSGEADPFLVRSSEALPHQGPPDPSSSGAARLCLIRGSWTLPRHEQQGSASSGAAVPFLNNRNRRRSLFTARIDIWILIPYCTTHYSQQQM